LVGRETVAVELVDDGDRHAKLLSVWRPSQGEDIAPRALSLPTRGGHRALVAPVTSTRMGCRLDTGCRN